MIVRVKPEALLPTQNILFHQTFTVKIVMHYDMIKRGEPKQHRSFILNVSIEQTLVWRIKMFIICCSTLNIFYLRLLKIISFNYYIIYLKPTSITHRK
jgi:hypothetical protein